MPEAYPLPSYAASIYTVGDQIILVLPPSPLTDRSHTVKLPNTPAGWQTVSMILKDRERQERSPTIASKGAPNQWNAEQILKAMKSATITKVPAVHKKDAPPTLTLKDLGL